MSLLHSCCGCQYRKETFFLMSRYSTSGLLSGEFIASRTHCGLFWQNKKHIWFQENVRDLQSECSVKRSQKPESYCRWGSVPIQLTGWPAEQHRAGPARGSSKCTATHLETEPNRKVWAWSIDRSINGSLEGQVLFVSMQPIQPHAVAPCVLTEGFFPSCFFIASNCKDLWTLTLPARYAAS